MVGGREMGSKDERFALRRTSLQTRTLVLLVHRAVATPTAEGVGLGVPLTASVETC